MEARFTKAGDGRYATRVVRDDNVTIEIRGYDRARGLPHDLAHFVVESELGLAFGFWGCVAAGAEFGSVTVVSGRRRPHARERSKAIVKEAGRRLTEAEVLVGVLIAAAGSDAKRCWPLVRTHLDRGWTIFAKLDEEALERACQRLRDTAARWADVPEGGELRLTWPVRPKTTSR